MLELSPSYFYKFIQKLMYKLKKRVNMHWHKHISNYFYLPKYFYGVSIVGRLWQPL